MSTLGILGGMGPYAGLRFCELLLEQSVRGGARVNRDFPHFLLSNLPVPDLISDRLSEEMAVAMVESEIRNLHRAGADMVVMACNTMHLFADRLRAASPARFLSMTDAVVSAVKADGIRCVGILGSGTTMQSGLYADPFQQRGIEVIVPPSTEQREVVQIILRVIAAENGPADQERLHSIIGTLARAGAEAVVLGCTELPLIVDKTSKQIALYDSLEILAVQAFEAMA